MIFKNKLNSIPNIVTNNCIGGFIYRDILNCEYQNPFIWSLIFNFNYFAQDFNNINFDNFKLINSNNIPNGYELIIDNKYFIKYIHCYFDKTKTVPSIVDTCVKYNKIDEYIIEKYLKRLKRMKKLNSTVFIVADINIGNDAIIMYQLLSQKNKILIFSTENYRNKFTINKNLKFYSIKKDDINYPKIITDKYKNEILNFIFTS
jgi:hypothetical protein